MYKVFNMNTGLYEDQASLEDAIATHNQLVSDYVLPLLKEKIPSETQLWDGEKQLAESFYQTFFGAYVPSKYDYTNFDIQNGQLKSRCFVFEGNEIKWLIKVNGALVLEVYELCSDEPNQMSITYDLNTKQPVFKYFFENGVFVKKDFYTNEVLATTVTGPLPSEYQALLDNYPDIKDLVTLHGQRSYGYVVEYVEPMVMVDNPNVEVERAELVAEGKRRANIIFEAPNEQGLITTQIIDTSTF